MASQSFKVGGETVTWDDGLGDLAPGSKHTDPATARETLQMAFSAATALFDHQVAKLKASFASQPKPKATMDGAVGDDTVTSQLNGMADDLASIGAAEVGLQDLLDSRLIGGADLVALLLKRLGLDPCSDPAAGLASLAAFTAARKGNGSVGMDARDPLEAALLIHGQRHGYTITDEHRSRWAAPVNPNGSVSKYLNTD